MCVCVCVGAPSQCICAYTCQLCYTAPRVLTELNASDVDLSAMSDEIRDTALASLQSGKSPLEPGNNG